MPRHWATCFANSSTLALPLTWMRVSCKVAACLSTSSVESASRASRLARAVCGLLVRPAMLPTDPRRKTGSTPKRRSRKQPYCLIESAEQWGNEARQELVPFNQNGHSGWQIQQIFQDESEPFPVKAVKRAKHLLRRPLGPSLVHSHGDEGVEHGMVGWV
jgi:hypothetical protein